MRASRPAPAPAGPTATSRPAAPAPGRSARLRQLLAGAALALAALPGPAALPPYPEALYPELRDLLLAAREQSPALETQDLLVEQAEGGELAAGAARRPSLFLSSRLAGSYEYREDLDDTRSRAMADASLTLRQPLYAWGALESAAHLGRLRREMAGLERRQAARLLLREVREGYAQLWLARHGSEVTENQLAVTRKLLADQEDLFLRGRLPEQQILETRLQTEELSEHLAGAARAVATLESALADAAGPGTDPTALARVTFAEFPLPEEEELRALPDSLGTAPGEAPGLLRARQELALEEEQEVLLRARQKPRLDAVAGVFQDQLDDYATNETALRVFTFGGLQITWNLFDGYETRGLLISQQARQRLAERQIERQGRLHQRTTRDLADQARFHRAQVVARERRVQLLGQSLALREQQVRQQAASLNDLLLEQIRHAQARRSAYEARLNLLTVLARLRVEYADDPLLQGWN